MSSGNDKMLSNQALFLLENRNYSKLYNFCRDQELEVRTYSRCVSLSCCIIIEWRYRGLGGNKSAETE